jgi:hypothetical protein
MFGAEGKPHTSVAGLLLETDHAPLPVFTPAILQFAEQLFSKVSVQNTWDVTPQLKIVENVNINILLIFYL